MSPIELKDLLLRHSLPDKKLERESLLQSLSIRAQASTLALVTPFELLETFGGASLSKQALSASFRQQLMRDMWERIPEKMEVSLCAY